jgi:DNA-binding NarL/FixJ family response regulator
MKDSTTKILLLESSEKSDSFLLQILIEKGYQTETISKIEPVIEKIMNQTVDLVICDNNVNEYNGFAVFKILTKYLRNSGIPFFLVLDSYEKNDVLIGLEMGIDNFIFSPINKASVYYKIENQLSKREELNIFKSGNFKEYFQSSSVAMFFVSNNKIVLVNQALCKLNNDCANNILELPVGDVFNIAENKHNELNYRRFQNGITDQCKLINVPCVNNSSFIFDISFYRGNNQGATHVFAELVPVVFAKLEENIMGLNQRELIDNVVVKTDRDAHENQANTKLTEREQQVFELSASGLPIKIIAGKLELSERTVEKHRANIMAKTNAKNMIEAIVYIQKHYSQRFVQILTVMLPSVAYSF